MSQIHLFVLATIGLIFSLNTSCGDSDSTMKQSNSNPDASVPPPVVDCLKVQEFCPEKEPYFGARCVNDLECAYGEAPNITWTYTCKNERWEAEANCHGLLGCTPVPPLAERCEAPFQETIVDGQIKLGPSFADESFRAYQDQEMVELVWGLQGSPMLEYRIQMSGEDIELVSCFGYTARLKVDGVWEAESKAPLTVRCGQSLRIYSIIESQAVCDQRVIDVEIEIEIEGVGTSSAAVKFEGGNCFG